MSPLTPGALAQVACLLEATARKPGNVHPGRGFADAHYLDYALSAQAVGPALDRARAEGVGVAVLGAVRATRAVSATNTNLGMVLLLAPLAAVPAGMSLDDGVSAVLEALTIGDARRVYRAVRLAGPGGLGVSAEQDVAGEPTVTLLEAMRLAAGRDAVARQYAEGYRDVFGLALPALVRALDDGRPLEDAVVAAHLAVLSATPDTLIARKRGRATAEEASRRAALVVEAGGPGTAEGDRRLDDLDRWLRGDGHARNPGATADLVAAALYAALRDGLIRLPIAPGGWADLSFEKAIMNDPELRKETDPAASKTYRVRVSKDELVFSSGHFITYEGDKCEPVHGHNYRVAVEVEGGLDENHYVIDFIALRDLTRALTGALDHRMLLPTASRLIALADDGANWLVRFGDRRWSFPKEECALLPVANTTAEALADLLAGRLIGALGSKGVERPRVLRVEVEESFGQSARVEWRPGGPGAAGEVGRG